MMKFTVMLLFLVSLISANGRVPSDSTLGIRRLVAPDYPTVARQAQVVGDVHLLARVKDDGRVESSEVLSGPPVLASHAQKNVLTWQFTKQPDFQKVEIIYRYRLQEPKVHGQVVPSVELESPTEIVIASNLPSPSGHPE
jgi:hypothetical protein